MNKMGNLKLEFANKNLNNEFVFEILKGNDIVGNTGVFLGPENDELSKLADQMAFEREIRIKFYACYDFELNKENVQKNNLDLSHVGERLYELGIGIGAFKNLYSGLFQN